MRLFCVKTEHCINLKLPSPPSSSYYSHSLPGASYCDEFAYILLVHFSYFTTYISLGAF